MSWEIIEKRKAQTRLSWAYPVGVSCNLWNEDGSDGVDVAFVFDERSLLDAVVMCDLSRKRPGNSEYAVFDELEWKAFLMGVAVGDFNHLFSNNSNQEN